jgi:hypothetical protein
LALGDDTIVVERDVAVPMPGEFVIPHGLAIDSRDRLYVVDASNQRVQVFALP